MKFKIDKWNTNDYVIIKNGCEAIRNRNRAKMEEIDETMLSGKSNFAHIWMLREYTIIFCDDSSVLSRWIWISVSINSQMIVNRDIKTYKYKSFSIYLNKAVALYSKEYINRSTAKRSFKNILFDCAFVNPFQRNIPVLTIHFMVA